MHMVKKTTTTKKTTAKKPVSSPAKKPIAKKTVKKASTTKTDKSIEAKFYPNLVTFLVSVAAVMILFALALLIAP